MADETGGPRTDVLAERIDNLASRVGSLDQRMSGLATEATIITLINGRDAVYNAQIDALREDVVQLAAALATERAERMAADIQNEERSSRARTLSIAAIGVACAFFFGIVGLIAQLGGVA